MAELVIPNSSDLLEAKQLLYGYDSFSGTNWNGTSISDSDSDSQKQKLGAIAIGSECIVLPHPEDSNLVYGLWFTPPTADRAQLIYNTHKVLSTLFPFNFPKIYLSSGVDYKIPNLEEAFKISTATVRQRINGRFISHFRYDYKADGITNRVSEGVKRFLRQETDVKHPFSRAIREVNSLGCSPVLDSQRGNFIIGEDGGEYYVDTIKKTLADFDRDRTLSYMKRREFRDEEIQDVDVCLNNIQVLRSKLGPDMLSFGEIVSLMV